MEMQQAQYPSSAAAPFFPGYQYRKAPRLVPAGAVPFFPTNDALTQLGNLHGTLLPQQQQVLIDGATLFCSEAESGLTCNASASRKRAFLDGNVAHAVSPLNLQQQLHVPHLGAPPVEASATAGTPSPLQVSCHSIRLDDCLMASTSGRSSAAPPPPAISPLVEELLSEHYQQRLDVDAFIRLQNERIRSGVKHIRKRHHRALLSAMGQGVLRRLREKDAELESARRRNADLEEKVQELASENQVWSNVARKNEAIASSLRATLEQALLHHHTTAAGGWEEGCGEIDCAAPALAAGDAQSCWYDGGALVAEAEQKTAAGREKRRELGLRRVCRVCGKREVAVLMVPCRHLCLCGQCDPGIDSCPVCNAAKKASLRVFMC